jgi:bacterioferritin-associated ferredoxin
VFVCHCKVVTSRTIRELAAQGVRTTREVTRETGAGSVCGRCQTNVSRILRSAVEELGEQSDVSAARDDPPCR